MTRDEFGHVLYLLFRAVGCILCELLGRRALFTGKDHLDQIKKIIEVSGTGVWWLV